MPSAFITGANGYIGFSVAKKLREQGYKVFGLIRSEQQAQNLRANEIIPVIGDSSKLNEVSQFIDQSHIIVATTLVGPDFKTHDLGVLTAVQESAKRTGLRKKFIYTSGCLVIGGKITEEVQVFDEDDKPLSVPGTWRIAVEEAVKSSSSTSLVDGVVLRPGYVYGGSGGKFIGGFGWENDGNSIKIVGSPLKRYGWVHVDDLASLYVKVAEASSSIVGAQVFNGVDDTRVTHEQVIRAFAAVSGFKGTFEYVPIDPNNWWQSFTEQSCVASYAKATRLLGWKPTRSSVLDDLSLYYDAWKASK